MKKILLFIAALFSLSMMYAQENDETKKMTKFEEFSSKTGSITKFVDVDMPNIQQSIFGTLGAGIRTIIGSEENVYFYRIEEPETKSSISHVAMIEYSDLVEINKALDRLVSEVNSDVQNNPDYLENKFITEDGFQIGYYVSKSKAQWFIKLERYTSSTVFVKNAEILKQRFKEAQSKIEELKNK